LPGRVRASRVRDGLVVEVGRKEGDHERRREVDEERMKGDELKQGVQK
jgi:hypothetical protein